MQEAELRKGPWLEEEDDHLAAAVAVLGDKRWDALAKASGIKRSGKSCRLRWMNYLRPNLKHGNISVEEERIIIELHQKWGNRWSKIARRLPGRTDNEIKNYWRSYSKKKAILLEKECSSSATKSPCDPMKEEDASGPSDDHAMAALSLTRSPYETRLTEWMSNWPPDIYRTTESRDELLNYDMYSPQWDCTTTSSTWDISLWGGGNENENEYEMK